MTLQEILDNVLLESGMGTETSYAGNTNDAVNRLVAIANRAADYLATGWAWQALRKTYTFSLTDATEYDMPEDFQQLIPDTTYADSYFAGADMRTDPGMWRYMKVNDISTGSVYRFRILGNKLQVVSPNNGDTISFEYLSNQAIRDAAGAPKRRFTADSDTWDLDDDLLTTDILWRHMRLVGLPQWQDARSEANRLKVLRQGQEAGSKTIVPGEYSEPDGVPYTSLWVNNNT